MNKKNILFHIKQKISLIYNFLLNTIIIFINLMGNLFWNWQQLKLLFYENHYENIKSAINEKNRC